MLHVVMIDSIPELIGRFLVHGAVGVRILPGGSAFNKGHIALRHVYPKC